MMRRYITALMLACCIGGYGQEKKQVTFVPPFDFPLTLSGNFGEIRSNHFHGGLDFKTGGVIGKPVRALADGYISRIRVTNGSGYVPVSYTHLDVYKRQFFEYIKALLFICFITSDYVVIVKVVSLFVKRSKVRVGDT